MSNVMATGLGLLLVLALTGCGPEEEPAPSAGFIPTPIASPTPQPTPTSASADPITSFDFSGGTRYPAMADLRIEHVSVAPGATEALVPVTLDRPTPNTVIARVMTRNGTGANFAFEGGGFSRVDQYVIFRPGDPLRKTVRIPLNGLKIGQHFELMLPESASGANVTGNAGRIEVVSGAAPGVAATSGFRAPRAFKPTGTLRYQLDPQTVRWSDGGSADTWSTALPHGRTQPDNQETGLYLDPQLHAGAAPPMRVENAEVVLHSQHLQSLIQYGGSYWKHGAAVLTGHRMASTQLRYGQYEWVAKMPNRRGAWPALWLLPLNGWPPEIDVYEGFGYSSDWNFSRHISANIHGGSGNNRTFTRLMRVDGTAAYGLQALDAGYRSYAVDIQKDYITWFIDNEEVYQAVNPFHEVSWFPIMNVAVKKDGDYTGGSGDMRIRSFRVWRN